MEDMKQYPKSSSSARSSDSIALHQHLCSIACLYDEGIGIEDKMAVKDNRG